jgi:hypothetical protein
MNNLPNLILKNGIKNLLEDDSTSFKKSLVDCLSIKLNDAIKEVETGFNEKIFESKETTESSEELKQFAEFVENYDPKLKNKLKLKNQSYININEYELRSLVGLFESLSAKNRQTMVREILESPSKLKSNIAFYERTKELR